jgi:hypothetical protein
MRTLLSLFLLACLLAPFLGSYLWVQIKYIQIRKEVKWKMIAGLDKEELVFMTFSIKDSQEKLNWKHSKEFEYRGKWYDVVQEEIMGDSIHFSLWRDHEETKLSQQLRHLIVQIVNQDSQNKENEGNIDNLFESLYFKNDLNWVCSHDLRILYNLVYKDHKNLSAYHTHDTPPPELFFYFTNK